MRSLSPNAQQEALLDTDIQLFLQDNELLYEFVLDVGRYLGYLHLPESDSWKFAGACYIFGCFCRLLYGKVIRPTTATPTAEAGSEQDPIDTLEELGLDLDGWASPSDHPADHPSQPAVAASTAGGTATDSKRSSWSANSSTGNYLRCCVLHVWYSKYPIDPVSHEPLPGADGRLQAFNAAMMVGEWMDEAIALYNTNVVLWQDPKRRIEPCIPHDWITGIVKTAQNNWIVSLASTARESSSLQTPDGDWKVCIKSRAGRLVWETYWCKVINRRKTSPSLSSPRAQPKRPSKADMRKAAISKRYNDSRGDEAADEAIEDGAQQRPSGNKRARTSGGLASFLDQFDDKQFELQVEEAQQKLDQQNLELVNAVRGMQDGLNVLQREFHGVAHELKGIGQGLINLTALLASAATTGPPSGAFAGAHHGMPVVIGGMFPVQPQPQPPAASSSTPRLLAGSHSSFPI